MNRKDLVKELISTIVPTVVVKTLSLIPSVDPITVPREEELTAEILRECEEISGTVDSEPQYAGSFGDMVATCGLIIEDLVSDIKAQIEQEIMMKVHIELSEMRSVLNDAKMDLICVNKAMQPPSMDGATGMQFNITEDVAIEPIASGYSSIAKYDVGNNSLANNPLFAMVSKSVERGARGESSHTAEDFNAARKNRADAEAEAAIITAEEKYYGGVDEEVSANEAWDKMFAQKYGGGE